MNNNEKIETLFHFRSDLGERQESIDLACSILETFRDTYMITEKEVYLREGNKKALNKRGNLIREIGNLNSYFFDKRDIENMLSFIIKTFGAFDRLVTLRGEEFVYEIERVYEMLSEDLKLKEEFTKSSLEIQRILLTVFAFYFNFSVNVLDGNRGFVDEEMIELKRRQKASLNKTFVEDGIISTFSTQLINDNLLCFYLTLKNSYGKSMGRLHLFGNCCYHDEKLKFSPFLRKRKDKFRGEKEEIEEMIDYIENNEIANDVIREFNYKYEVGVKANGEIGFIQREI